MSNKGNLIVVSAASGSGKTTLVNRVLAELPELKFSVSVTTRSPRPGERHGIDYFFTGEEEFEVLARQGAFLEHASVHDHRYGTSAAQVMGELDNGFDVLLDIDVQGAMMVKEKFPDAILVFVLPPSFEALKERLVARGQDGEEVIRKRLAKAEAEIDQYGRYQYLIINEDISRAAFELKLIVLASRCRTERRSDLADAIRQTFRAGP
jgi:guanylate kinase